jgi:DNA gyrase subunit B
MTDQDVAPPQTNQEYSEKDIQYLNPMQHIRLRPGMYVGGKDTRALHHLIYEVVDNSIDEALAGRCDRILVTLRDDGGVTITDNGVGIPVGLNKELGISTLEGVMTKVGMGGKFDSNAYKVSGGLHGVGVSAVNALSRELQAEVFREGHLYRQVYQQGNVITDVEKIRKLDDGEPTGTQITFWPDFDVLDPNEFDYNTLSTRFREMAFVTRKVTITLRDERVKPIPRESSFYFEGGLRAFVVYKNRERKALHDPIYGEREIDITPDNTNVSPFSVGVEVAFQYNDSNATTELAFANTIRTPDGGSHLTDRKSVV